MFFVLIYRVVSWFWVGDGLFRIFLLKGFWFDDYGFRGKKFGRWERKILGRMENDFLFLKLFLVEVVKWFFLLCVVEIVGVYLDF